MPRTARLHVPGGVFHAVSRFARDEWWLDRPGARDAYLELLGAATEASDTKVLAYALMSNHVHLVLVSGEARLSRFFKSVHTGFAAWARASSRSAKALGPVFAGRPRTVLIDTDAYLLELVRYVHNNPVRAGVARTARNSDWTSHRAYVGRAEAPSWLEAGRVLASFGRERARAASRFEAFVDEGRTEPRRPELSGASDAGEGAAVRAQLGDGHRVSDGVLGSAAFVAKVMQESKVRAALSERASHRRAGSAGRPSVREAIDAALETCGLEPHELEHRPRTRLAAHAKRLAIWAWVHEYEGEQIEVARALGLHTGAVSYHYACAVRAAGAFDEECTALVALLRRRGRARPRVKTSASADSLPVRYVVDVNET
jgi:REP element-mobilizing transposase RayT